MVSPTLPVTAVPSWKKFALSAFFFGFGAATVCALVVAGFLFYRYHEDSKPWTSPMKATFTGLQLRRATDAITAEFQYAIENTTNKDYRFPFDSTIMMLLPEGQGYKSGEQAHITWEHSAFIPSKNKVNVTVVWSFTSTDFTLPPENSSKVVPFVDKRLTENDGFAIFDQKNRYRIDLPNVWKDWAEIKKFLDDEKQKHL